MFIHSVWAKNYQPQAKKLVANDANCAPTRKQCSSSIQKGKSKSEYLSHKRISWTHTNNGINLEDDMAE